jgi:hypothetical protein
MKLKCGWFMESMSDDQLLVEVNRRRQDKMVHRTRVSEVDDVGCVQVEEGDEGIEQVGKGGASFVEQVKAVGNYVGFGVVVTGIGLLNIPEDERLKLIGLGIFGSAILYPAVEPVVELGVEGVRTVRDRWGGERVRQEVVAGKEVDAGLRERLSGPDMGSDGPVHRVADVQEGVGIAGSDDESFLEIGRQISSEVTGDIMEKALRLVPDAVEREFAIGRMKRAERRAKRDAGD